MLIKIHPHAKQRLQERGATEIEIIKTIYVGETFPAKFGRIGFRHNFSTHGYWRGKPFNTKQLEVYAVKENNELIVLTVIVKYF